MRLEPTRLLSASPVVPPRREVHGFTALCVYTSRDGPMGPAGLLRGRALHPPIPRDVHVVGLRREIKVAISMAATRIY